MFKLRTEVLNHETHNVFNVLSQAEELNNISLIGGTALALQIGHRVSLDLDFASFSTVLPTHNIDHLISRLKAESELDISEVIDQPKASVFKINTGNSIRDFARDYVINGTKVTFFTHGKNELQRKFYRSAEKVKNTDMQFDLLGLDGLKVSKTLVLADRATSRDLYDLMVLMRDYTYSLYEVASLVKEMGHIDDFEHYRAVMTGELPLDTSDPGLLSVGVEISINEIYTFFEEQFDVYDIKKTEEMFQT